MKQKLLFLGILLFISFCSFSQAETVTINWGFNSVPFPEDDNGTEDQDTSITIEVGDTVVWDWIDAFGHNVISDPGATETFGTGDPGDTFLGPDYTYEYTFTMVGINPFVCSPHQSIMYGTITVVPEGTLSINTVALDEFKLYPNPGKTELNIALPTVSNSHIEVFDVLGKRIYFQDLTEINTKINIAQWQSGVYLVKITGDNSSETRRFIKQ